MTTLERVAQAIAVKRSGKKLAAAYLEHHGNWPFDLLRNVEDTIEVLKSEGWREPGEKYTGPLDKHEIRALRDELETVIADETQDRHPEGAAKAAVEYFLERGWQKVPEGWAVVPRELTFEMHEYADTFELHDHCIQTKVLLATELWKAVISHLDKTRVVPEVGDA